MIRQTKTWNSEQIELGLYDTKPGQTTEKHGYTNAKTKRVSIDVDTTIKKTSDTVVTQTNPKSRRYKRHMQWNGNQDDHERCRYPRSQEAKKNETTENDTAWGGETETRRPAKSFPDLRKFMDRLVPVVWSGRLLRVIRWRGVGWIDGASVGPIGIRRLLRGPKCT